MVNLKDKTVRIYGYGLFECFMALRLKRDFGKVELFIPWKASYPTPLKTQIGEGLPGVTKITNFFDGIGDVDLFCFFDVGDGDLQNYLRSKGKRVFGSGKAEELEYDRVGFKSVLKSVKLPVPEYKVVKGISELRNELLKNENLGKWVKISTFRGIQETFKNNGIKYIQPKLDSIAFKLGSFREIQEFLIENNICGKEIGSDFFLANGEMLDYVTVGMENKDKSYSCKVVRKENVPSELKIIDNALNKVYKKFKYCGMGSSEVRVGMDNKPYFIDFCARAGSPPSELISEIYSNFSEIVWAVAGGEIVEQKVTSFYGAEILLKSEMAVS